MKSPDCYDIMVLIIVTLIVVLLYYAPLHSNEHLNFIKLGEPYTTISITASNSIAVDDSEISIYRGANRIQIYDQNLSLLHEGYFHGLANISENWSESGLIDDVIFYDNPNRKFKTPYRLALYHNQSIKVHDYPVGKFKILNISTHSKFICLHGAIEQEEGIEVLLTQKVNQTHYETNWHVVSNWKYGQDEAMKIKPIKEVSNPSDLLQKHGKLPAISACGMYLMKEGNPKNKDHYVPVWGALNMMLSYHPLSNQSDIFNLGNKNIADIEFIEGDLFILSSVHRTSSPAGIQHRQTVSKWNFNDYMYVVSKG